MSLSAASYLFSFWRYRRKMSKTANSFFGITSVFIDYREKEHVRSYVYNLLTNQAGKSRLLSFKNIFKEFQNLTNREFLTQFV